MDTTTFVGIDPGKSGAIAILSPGSVQILDCPLIKLGGNRTDYNFAAAAAILRGLDPAHSFVAIERVASRPGQGVVSTFTFGTGYGLWLGILAALELPHELVSPQTWKKNLMAGQPKDKGASIQVAGRLFPNCLDRVGKNHNRAEALLIAEWARRSYGGMGNG